MSCRVGLVLTMLFRNWQTLVQSRKDIGSSPVLLLRLIASRGVTGSPQLDVLCPDPTAFRPLSLACRRAYGSCVNDPRRKIVERPPVSDDLSDWGPVLDGSKQVADRKARDPRHSIS